MKPSSRFQHLIRRIWPIRDWVIWAAVSLLLLGMVDNLVINNFQREQLYRQTLIAQQIRAQLQSALEEHVTALLGLNVVYQNFVDINHYDFQQYGKAISANLPGFRRLFFADPSMTVRHIYPMTQENKGILGASLAKYPALSGVLKNARQSRKPTITDLVLFLNTPKDLLAVTPIYRNNREFLGYAVGEISLEKIWLPLSRADFMDKYQIQLQDSGKNPYFMEVNLDTGNTSLTQVPFQVADKRWSILLNPKHPLLASLHYQRIGLWTAGILIIVLLVLLLRGGKRHKMALGEAQKQFERIFNASPDGILLLDDKLRFRLSNPPIREWTGLNEEALEEKSFFDLFECQCPHLAKCRELSFLLCTSEQFEESLPETLETQLTHIESSHTRILRLNASRINETSEKNQGPKGFICVLGDISTAKELERVKETYVATLTHDLKTPLLAQEMLLESLLGESAGSVNESQAKLLSGAHQSVQDLLEMVNATLVFYKLESSHLQLQRVQVGLASLVKEVMETLQPLAENRLLTFEMENSLNIPEVRVDLVQMKRVFHNILYNAISYAERETTIRVLIKTEGNDSVMVQLINQGKGIPAEELPKIFDKYYSLSRKFKKIGTGLGLYISRRIVELHGGKIWAESEPDKETAFYVTIPSLQKV